MWERFHFNTNSIPIKITMYMVAILLATAVLILFITDRHFNEQTKRYHEDILKRKERAVLTSIDYLLDNYSATATSENIYNILEGKILEISDINILPIVIYDLKGNVILTTQVEEPRYPVLPKPILDSLNKNNYYNESIESKEDKRSYYATYSYIKNASTFQNLAIVNLPYETNDIFLQEDLFSLMGNYGIAFIFILLLGAIMIFLVSKNSFSKLSSFADRIKETEVISNNLPIQYDKNDEIRVLVDAYNEMLVKLKDQSKILANVERQEAWSEVARQVAHEIKNPLTPMKLMIQNYMRKFETEDDALADRTKKTSNILLQQIETIETIANAFSDFAKMPSRQDELIDIVEIVNNTLEIFPKNQINFTYSHPEIMMMFDKQYLNRIVTNIVKNSFQSIPANREPTVTVNIYKKKDSLFIEIEDNGKGISEDNQSEIFRPRFTTKSSGTGIGLSMVKKIIDDYDGIIRFESIVNKGTKFIIQLPYIKNEKAI